MSLPNQQLAGATLRIDKLTPNLGAAVHDIDLRHVDDDLFAAIDAALVEHKVLFFENQQWSAAEQREFAQRFGPLHVHPLFDTDPDHRDLVVFAYDDRRKGNNDTWHADVTFVETPVKVSVLHAVEIPPVGGDTLWLDAEAAYRALSEPIKRLIGELKAVHSFFKGFPPAAFARYGHEQRIYEVYASLPPVAHPIVTTHPVSGRKSIYVNRAFTTHIEGLSTVESDHLLRLLLEHLEKPEFQVRWRWRKDTVAIWDNRSTQHLAVSDYFPARRSVRRAAVLGERPV